MEKHKEQEGIEGSREQRVGEHSCRAEHRGEEIAEEHRGEESTEIVVMKALIGAEHSM